MEAWLDRPVRVVDPRLVRLLRPREEWLRCPVGKRHKEDGTRQVVTSTHHRAENLRWAAGLLAASLSSAGRLRWLVKLLKLQARSPF